MCRQLAPWRVGLEKVIGILVGPGEKGRKKKENTALYPIESIATPFGSNPFLNQW